MKITSFILVSIIAGTGIGYVLTNLLCSNQAGDSGCGYGFYFYSPLAAIILFTVLFVASIFLPRRNVPKLPRKYQIIVLVLLLLGFVIFANKILTETIGLQLF